MASTKRRANVAAAAVAAPQHDHDHDYALLLTAVQATFDSVTAGGSNRVFQTSARNGLWAIYLRKLPDERQVHRCQACERFIHRYGGLVCLDESGDMISALWDPRSVPPFYRDSVKAMQQAVLQSQVEGVFVDAQAEWGQPITGNWQHIAVLPSPRLRYSGEDMSAEQKMAEHKMDFLTVETALECYKPAVLTETLRLLESDVLSRSPHFVEPVRWLRDLQTARNAIPKKSRRRDNVLWRAVASAPSGFMHPRSSVLGPLMEAIEAKRPYGEIRAVFEAMVNSRDYQRPKAAPAAGTIRQAEALVEKLGLKRSLKRRYARLDECVTIWQSQPEKPTSAPSAVGGVFAAVTPKQPPTVAIPAVQHGPLTMTWVKFRDTVLPLAEQVEYLMPRHKARFIAMVTAQHRDAPPLLKWDYDDARNPVSWYCPSVLDAPEQWSMVRGQWARVSAVVPLPTLWGTPARPDLHEGYMLALAGCRDTGGERGIALFPEILRDDLHGVRSVMESYSNTEQLGGRVQANACGVDVRKGPVGHMINELLRVRRHGQQTSYMIDRYD